MLGLWKTLWEMWEMPQFVAWPYNKPRNEAMSSHFLWHFFDLLQLLKNGAGHCIIFIELL